MLLFAALACMVRLVCERTLKTLWRGIQANALSSACYSTNSLACAKTDEGMLRRNALAVWRLTDSVNTVGC